MFISRKYGIETKMKKTIRSCTITTTQLKTVKIVFQKTVVKNSWNIWLLDQVLMPNAPLFVLEFIFVYSSFDLAKPLNKLDDSRFHEERTFFKPPSCFFLITALIAIKRLVSLPEAINFIPLVIC